MAAGITFRIGGALDPSFRGALNQSVAESQAAAARANKLLKAEMTALQVQLQNPMGRAVAAAAGIDLVAEIKKKQDLITHITAAAAAERLAITKAEQMAMVVAIARGRGAAAGAASLGGHGGGGITGIVRESLVIIREFAMGRGLGRIGGSVTLLAQYLGVLKLAVKSSAAEAVLASEAATKLSVKMAQLAVAARGTSGEAFFVAQSLKQEAVAAKAAEEANIALAASTVKLRWAFFAWAGVIVAAVAALVILVEAMRAAKNSAKDLADHLAKTHDEFADGVEALEAHHKAMLDDAKAAAELNDWIEKLGKTTATTTDQLEEQLDAMKERFEFQKKIAEQNGASPAKIAAMEQAERKAELDVANAALEKAKKDAADAKAAGIKAAQDAQAHARLIDENKGKKDFDKTISAVEYLNSRIPQEIKDKIAANQKIIDDQTARDTNGEDSTFGQLIAAGAAARENAKLKSTEYGKQSLVGIGDGKAMVSPDEVDGIYHQALTARALFLKGQEDLQRDQDALEKAKASKQGDATERAREVERLQKIVNKDQADIALHDEFDSQIHARGSKVSDILGLTSNQRAGAQVSGPAVALLDVNKRQLLHLASIDKKLGGGKPSPWGGKR